MVITTATKTRPILFSKPMVQAVLDNKKTQTRRVAKLDEFQQAYLSKDYGRVRQSHSENGQLLSCSDSAGSPRPDLVIPNCPYGKLGDRLWVREDHYRFGHWEAVPGVKTKTGRMKWRFVADNDEVLYDAPATYRKGRHHKDSSTPAWHKRLARFMPRAASRITLEITEIRVERLQEISEADAVAEGVKIPRFGFFGHDLGPISLFKVLWNSINGLQHPWDANPWVWIVCFQRVEG